MSGQGILAGFLVAAICAVVLCAAWLSQKQPKPAPERVVYAPIYAPCVSVDEWTEPNADGDRLGFQLDMIEQK